MGCATIGLQRKARQLGTIMSNIEQLSVKQLIEKQGYGSLPVVLAADDEANDLRPILDTQDAAVMTCTERECHGLGAYVVIG